MVQHWDRLWVFLLPKRMLTAVVGWFARRRVSRRLIPWFISAYAINVDEAELPVGDYQTWVEFFSRKLRKDVRPIASGGLISPVDGTASASGDIRDGMLIQAKGQLYSLAALVGEERASKQLIDGQYLTLYLSPHDYHRVHMPLAGRIVRWVHIPGNLYPVNSAGVRSVKGLFTKNERLVVEIESVLGNFFMVLVGATIVGSIRTPFGPEYASPLRRARMTVRQGLTDFPLDRGDELGMFEFGSTVILLFPPEMRVEIDVREGDAVRMGQMVANLPSSV